MIGGWDKHVPICVPELLGPQTGSKSKTDTADRNLSAWGLQIRYQNLKKLPNEVEDAIEELKESKELRNAFDEDVINSYIKLKNQEIEDFNRNERFDKKSPITDWEKNNTLDC